MTGELHQKSDWISIGEAVSDVVENMRTVDIDLLNEFLCYDQETGHLTWKHRDTKHFPSYAYSLTWNKKNAHKPALNCINHYGYRHGAILGRNFLAHRVIYAMHYGKWPNKQIDHINGIRTDNRIKNLREVTGSENLKNQKISVKNKSGVTGVCRHGNTDKWVAFIKVNRRKRHLGLFSRFEDAVKARKQAEKELGFHENHGRKPA